MSVIGCGVRWSETKGAKFGGIHERILEVRQWRAHEHAADRPSGLEDWYRVNGLCFACQAYGTDPSPTGWDGEVPLFSDCEVCGGTGKIGD